MGHVTAFPRKSAEKRFYNHQINSSKFRALNASFGNIHGYLQAVSKDVNEPVERYVREKSRFGSDGFYRKLLGQGSSLSRLLWQTCAGPGEVTLRAVVADVTAWRPSRASFIFSLVIYHSYPWPPSLLTLFTFLCIE